MINYAEIVPQPYSGEYNEKIYDIENVSIDETRK